MMYFVQILIKYLSVCLSVYEFEHISVFAATANYRSALCDFKLKGVFRFSSQKYLFLSYIIMLSQAYCKPLIERNIPTN